jgi:hypothetical protein
MKSKTQERTTRRQTKVLEYLQESGNVSYACKRAGISRETYYQWRDEESFARKANVAIDLGKEFVNDLAHTKLVGKIQEGNMHAISLQLKSCHPDYQPRKPRPPEEERFSPVKTIRIVRAPSREEIENERKSNDEKKQ